MKQVNWRANPTKEALQPGLYLTELCTSTPPAQGLVEMQHGDVGEVGHAGDGLQEPEALDRALCVDGIQADAEGQVCPLDPPGRCDRLV